MPTASSQGQPSSTRELRYRKRNKLPRLATVAGRRSASSLNPKSLTVANCDQSASSGQTMLYRSGRSISANPVSI